MNKYSFSSVLTVTALIMCLGVPVLADTIRLKDGSVIRGQVVGFKDQQFTVLVGTGARGRRSRISIYMEDVESVEFDSTTAANADTGGSAVDDTGAIASTTTPPATQPPAARPTTPRTNTTPPPRPDVTTTGTQPASRTQPAFFQINTRVRGDNTANGWTNTGLVVRRGQRLRITATGRVTLGAGRSTGPEGVPSLPDRDKLMRNEATGGLIAVVGDDNDDFIFIGRNRDFIAQRDGVLFLGVNEGNLNDNTGAYDAVIEAEAIGSATR